MNGDVRIHAYLNPVRFPSTGCATTQHTGVHPTERCWTCRSFCRTLPIISRRSPLSRKEVA